MFRYRVIPRLGFSMAAVTIMPRSPLLPCTYSASCSDSAARKLEREQQSARERVIRTQIADIRENGENYAAGVAAIGLMAAGFWIAYSRDGWFRMVVWCVSALGCATFLMLLDYPVQTGGPSCLGLWVLLAVIHTFVENINWTESDESDSVVAIVDKLYEKDRKRDRTV